MSATIPFEQLVIELCKETGEPGFMNNQTIVGCLLDGIRDLSLHNMPVWETAKDLCLNDYNAIDWPCECIKPLIVFLERDGRAVAIDVSDDILHTVDSRPNNFEDADREINDYFRIDRYDEYYKTYGWGLGELYGVGDGYGHLGMVTHDKNRRQSFIKGCTIRSTDTFGMFFKSSGLSNAPMFVPAEAKEALEYFALKKYYRTRNPQLGELNLKNYKEEFTRLSKFWDDEGSNTWRGAFRANSVGSPKF